MILYELKKKYAKSTITFEEDLNMDSDGWFINIKNKTKNGILKRNSLIIRKDIETWLNKYLNDGWEIV